MKHRRCYDCRSREIKVAAVLKNPWTTLTLDIVVFPNLAKMLLSLDVVKVDKVDTGEDLKLLEDHFRC